MSINKNLIIIGYSGHAYVCIDVALSLGMLVTGYFDQASKKMNPYQLRYYGSEKEIDAVKAIESQNFFVGIGDNKLREKISLSLSQKINRTAISLVCPKSIISEYANISSKGVLVMPSATINSLAIISEGVICNTASIIEHECEVGKFAHIAPGAVLAGNVKIGERSFIGANAVIKQGVRIGNDVIVGAGSVILNDVPDNVTIVGNPGKILKSKL